MTKRKKLKEGYKKLDIFDLDGFVISEPGFFEKYVPDGCELVRVQIYAEREWYNEGDEAHFMVYWREVEKS